MALGPDKKKIIDLENRLDRLNISKRDIREKFIKASGRGGQKVNKSSSAVFLRHEPSGISVKVGKSRSLHLNRFLALRSLVDKIEAQNSGKPDRESEKIARLRKQKQKRKKKARKKREES